MIKNLWSGFSMATRLMLIFTFVAVAMLASIQLGAPIGVEHMLMAVAPFPVTPELVAVAVGYKNRTMIADEVLPRVGVTAQQFKYNKYPIGEFFSPPDTTVGRKGKPNEVEFTATETADATVDQALDDKVPLADIENAKGAPGVPDPEKRAALGVTELIVLRREVRAGALVFNNANYAAANKVVLAGATQWSDFVNSDPVAAVLNAFDGMVMRPTIGVIGRATHTKLSTHPKICKAVFGNNTDAGIVSRQQLAQLFELEDWLVGEGWVNTAKKGQPAVLARVWGKHAAFLHRNMNATPEFGITFGMTAQWGSRVAGSTFDKDIGMRGGMQVRVGESVKELVTANDLGYFFETAVA
jgi:hypothetical protein